MNELAGKYPYIAILKLAKFKETHTDEHVAHFKSQSIMVIECCDFPFYKASVHLEIIKNKKGVFYFAVGTAYVNCFRTSDLANTIGFEQTEKTPYLRRYSIELDTRFNIADLDVLKEIIRYKGRAIIRTLFPLEIKMEYMSRDIKMLSSNQW